ncbi:MAG TPA: HD domain-containing protein [Syntrophorhabdaceae bacterium]|nr:HD domain-containing protein [Syntrophorhabdaceae bacterium]
MVLTRDEALTLLHEYVKNERMLYHCYASEAVLRAIATRLGEDQEKWGMAGLLHDLDIELVDTDLARHGLEAGKILREKGYDADLVDAIVMHNESASGAKRASRFQHALAAGETITGLIIATTLVYPDKKLASVKPKSVTKRMKERAFAASVNRDIVMECEKIGIPLDEFAALSVSAMQAISDRIGL